tara:strand:+ start:1823 stop:2284 length:462 start_codon:yes stop_codon:yes gene_type:complete
MRAVYLHGLGSTNIGEKNDFLKDHFDAIYDPKIDYRKKGIYAELFKEIKVFKPDVIIGSSMGGWFAYNIANKLGLESLLFNPAMQNRSIEPEITTKGVLGTHNIVFGKKDDVVIAIDSLESLFKDSAKFIHKIENIGHRIPFKVFTKHIKNIK